MSNSAIAQQIDYLKKANEAFIKGNYAYAVTMYKMYYVETGKDISELQHQAVLCRDYLKNADDAALTKDYATATMNYKKILELNPEDASVKTKLSSLKNVVSTPSLKLGQEYLGGRIAYIDNTGKHGFVITHISIEPMTHYKGIKETPKGSRVPTLRELKMIAPCADLFKLCSTSFWAIDLARKNGIYGSDYYSIFFKEESGGFETNIRYKKERKNFIYIKDF